MKLSGLGHERSFEWNEDSNRTHNHNFSTSNTYVDIRSLEISDLPDSGIDIVVGSPPCTQFSFSNKGGKGDIEDGLIDMYKFLQVVDHVKPKYWAMENVPRVKNILEKLLTEDIRFKKFARLFNYIGVVDCSEYGLPQRRRRMIAGFFPYENFLSYRTVLDRMDMGTALSALSNVSSIKDPTYHFSLPASSLEDHVKESPLTPEELRINREAKEYHPVYNVMSFPEVLTRPSRTITSTCTRVSRESLIIQDGKGYRRLTVRERATLMGFPISYQFYGRSFSSKLKMIGNAIPPVLSYYLFQSMLGKDRTTFTHIRDARRLYKHPLPKDKAPKTQPDGLKYKYRPNRSFRLALPRLRFGSGVRFDLSNINESRQWRVSLYYGNSKSFKCVQPDIRIAEMILSLLDLKQIEKTQNVIERTMRFISTINSKSLQESWSHTSESTHPFEVVDHLSELALDFKAIFSNIDISNSIFETILNGKPNKKLYSSIPLVLSGLLLAYYFNHYIDGNKTEVLSPKRLGVVTIQTP